MSLNMLNSGVLNVPTNNLTVTNNSSLKDLTVTNNASIAGNVNVSGNANVTGELNVSGDASFGNVTIVEDLTINSINIAGNTYTTNLGVNGLTSTNDLDVVNTSSLRATTFNNNNITNVASISGPALRLIQPSNRSGSVTVAGENVINVPCTGVTANSVIILTTKIPNGMNAGRAFIYSITGGVGFAITSDMDDLSTYNFIVLDIM